MRDPSPILCSPPAAVTSVKCYVKLILLGVLTRTFAVTPRLPPSSDSDHLNKQGPFLSFVFATERAAFAVGYCLSFVGVLYASLVQKSYFLTLFCVVAELVSLSYLLLSYVPGGTRFLNFVFSMVLSGCKMLCGRCLGGGDG